MLLKRPPAGFLALVVAERFNAGREGVTKGVSSGVMTGSASLPLPGPRPPDIIAESRLSCLCSLRLDLFVRWLLDLSTEAECVASSGVLSGSMAYGSGTVRDLRFSRVD